MPYYDKHLWIDDTLDGKRITFPQYSNSVWELRHKISENSQQWDEPHESKAVFVCKQVEGPRVGAEEIIKVHMQIPHTPYPRRLTPEIRESLISMEVNIHAQKEIEALDRLTAAGCSCSPKLLAWIQEKQDASLPLPGGYVIYILMEKLPGESPHDLFMPGRSTLEERDQIRASFRPGFEELRKHGILPMDAGARNILWDKENRKW
ncbi:MAG: hypothetical protein M1829_000276 [Trizodia sp. TS-e1964]|nr:MAG: hypothetical protein M1829_000276 [Trizodia sp. TS-e1964]